MDFLNGFAIPTRQLPISSHKLNKMKNLLTFLFLLFSFSLFSQKTESQDLYHKDTSDSKIIHFYSMQYSYDTLEKLQVFPELFKIEKTGKAIQFNGTNVIQKDTIYDLRFYFFEKGKKRYFGKQ
jgi:hypothetical protein